MDQTSALAAGENKSGEAQGSVISLSATRDESERNPIFDALVSAEGEVAGLVAYSIYKQNKRSWLDDFIKLTGRTPTEAETRAYIIGESTERRLATYRQLAAATLGGQTGSSGAPASVSRVGALNGVLWAMVALVALAVLGYVLHAGSLVGAK
jgi:hypothetical protein